MNEPTANPVDTRLNTWQTGLTQELQELLQSIAIYRQDMDNAKTQTTKQYYKKKLKKLTNAAIPLLAALDRISKMQDVPKEVSNDNATSE